SRSRVKRTFGFPYGPYFYPGYPYGGFGGFFPPPIRFPPRFTNPFGQFGANLNLGPFGPFGPFGFDVFGPFRPGAGGNRGGRFGPPNPGFGLGIFGSGPAGSGGFDIFFNRG
ncbi:unnamed protein product, partial [Onchocerca flexuosa]|uniref:Glycine rich superfamily member n=1 Tax=Onchocerca flexuosa TaxID=387005 RepID=A0A183HUT9_9BILA